MTTPGEPARTGRLGTFVAEVRRRRVLRALLGWGIASFAVLQVIEPVLHALHLPDWVLTAVVGVLAVGFPASVVLAWFFDLSAAGVTRTADAPPDVSGAAPQVRNARLLFAGLVAVGAVVGAGVAWLALRQATPAAAVGADGRVFVAVADFANDTRDPDLDGLSGLLITSLEQSRKLRVMTRGRMIDLLRQAGKGDAARIDEALARDAGRKAGVRALLVASIRKLGETYAVELRALDPEKDEYLFTLSEKATAKNDLLPLVDRLSDRVRERLRESAAEVSANEVSVAQAVTSDLEAYRHYFKGMERLARLDDDGALEEFRAALAIDPRFALAHLEVARWEAFMVRDSRRSFELAGANVASLPVKERELVRASVGSRDGREDEKEPILESLAARFPDDRNVALAAARAVGCPEQIPYLRRALQLAPDWDRTRIWLVYCLSEQGRWTEAIAEAEAAEAARPSPSSSTVVALARYISGDVDGAISAVRRAAQGGHSRWTRGLLVSALATRGDFAAAREEAKGLPDDMGPQRAIVPAEQGRLRDCLALQEAFGRQEGSNRNLALRFSRAIVASANGSAPAGAGDAGPGTGRGGRFWTLVIHDPQELESLVAQTEPGSADGRLARALLVSERGDRAGAVDILGRVQDHHPDLESYYLGILASELGRDEEALGALREFERGNTPYFNNVIRAWQKARVRFHLARSLDRLGRRDEARAVLARQLDRWKDADTDLPLLADMKSLCAKIDCRKPPVTLRAPPQETAAKP